METNYQYKGDNQMKRKFLVALAIVMLVAAIAFPASAAETYVNDFPHFPLANPDYANVYKPQTVAVQRFLMCYDDTYRARLAAHHGTDGYFGSETTSVTKLYQKGKGLSQDGRVGPATWTAIGDDLTEIGVDSIGPVFFLNGYHVLYIVPQNNRSGYVAKTDAGGITSIFYYID